MSKTQFVHVFGSEVFKGHQWAQELIEYRTSLLKKKRIADLIFWVGFVGLIGSLFNPLFLPGFTWGGGIRSGVTLGSGVLALIGVYLSSLKYGVRIQEDRNWICREMAGLAELLDVSMEMLCEMPRESVRALAHEKIMALAKQKLEYEDGMSILSYHNWPTEHREVAKEAFGLHLEKMGDDVNEMFNEFRSFRLTSFENVGEIYAEARKLVSR